MNYSKNYTPYRREEVIEKVSEQMSKKRLEHVLRVEKKAIELAEKYGADIEKASLSALLHDYAKEMNDKKTADVVINHGLELELLKFGSSIWHGPVGAVLVKEDFEIVNQEILDAIAFHTVGHPEMGEIAKIIYVADYIEDGRDFDGVEEARMYADESLNKGVQYESKKTLLYLIQKDKPVYPQAIETYNKFIDEGGTK